MTSQTSRYAFLSPEWVEAASAIRDNYVDRIPTPYGLKLNLIITNTPFGSEALNANIDSTSGVLRYQLGHLPKEDATLTAEYSQVMHMLVTDDETDIMEAFLAGNVRIQGDLSKILAFQASTSSEDPEIRSLTDTIRQITLD